MLLFQNEELNKIKINQVWFNNNALLYFVRFSLYLFDIKCVFLAMRICTALKILNYTGMRHFYLLDF